MNNILRVLVPVDFSKESELAIKWAQWIVKEKTGATLYLLHALPLVGKPHSGLANVGYDMELDAIKQRMKTWQNRLPEDLMSFPIFSSDRVPEAIARVCEERNIDLVVMTTRGRHGLTHVLEGSTTEETVRLAPCPVLVLHLNKKTQKLAYDDSVRLHRIDAQL